MFIVMTALALAMFFFGMMAVFQLGQCERDLRRYQNLVALLLESANIPESANSVDGEPPA